MSEKSAVVERQEKRMAELLSILNDVRCATCSAEVSQAAGKIRTMEINEIDLAKNKGENEKSVYVIEFPMSLPSDACISIDQTLSEKVPGAKFILLQGGAKIKCLRGPSQIKRIPKATRDELFAALKDVAETESEADDAEKQAHETSP